MPKGDKSKYTGKQKRMAGHIEKGYEKRGTGKKESERRAWATVNKTTGGGKRGGGGSKARSTGTRAKSTSKTKSRSRSKAAR